MKIVVVEPKSKPYVKEISGTLESMQEIVGGYITTVPSGIDNVLVICDEEGLLKNYEQNIGGLVGTIFFVGVATPEFRGLTDSEIDLIMSKLERLVRKDEK